MTGEGTSRIDTIITNPAAANMVDDIDQIYGTALAFDHTPFKVSFSAERFMDEQLVTDKPCKLEMPDHSKLSQKQRAELNVAHGKKS